MAQEEMANLLLEIQGNMCVYRISPPISPGLICLRKAFLVGLSSGEGDLSTGGLYELYIKYSVRKR